MCLYFYVNLLCFTIPWLGNCNILKLTEKELSRMTSGLCGEKRIEKASEGGRAGCNSMAVVKIVGTAHTRNMQYSQQFPLSASCPMG